MGDVTPAQRAAAWNVVFLDERDEVFAGFYHDPDKNPIRFADALKELNGGFTYTFGRNGKECGFDEWCWAIWPALDYASHGASTASSDSSEPPTPSMNMAIPPGRYYLLIHDNECSLKHWGLVSKHRLKESSCVSFVMEASYECLPDYRPLLSIARPEYKASFDNCLSRSKYAWARHTSGDFTSVIPRSRGGGMTQRLSLINGWNSFADRARESNGRCAITGLGRASSKKGGNNAIAPGFMLEAYHIIPPEHFDVYPVNQGSINREVTIDDTVASFDLTWTPPKNAILLLPHIYDLFRARLIAVHPKTLRIRVFAQCELVEQYNGNLANFDMGCEPDVAALVWHWNMCVEENVKAKVDPSPGRVPRGPDATLIPWAGADDKVQFCTQKCLRGLKVCGPFDVSCPNFRFHAEVSHPVRKLGGLHAYVGQDKWVTVTPGKLTWSNLPGSSQARVELIPGKHGNMGHLVRIILERGYVLVGKGMSYRLRASLEHEHNIYRRLKSLQGTAVTTCLGLVRLDPPFKYTCDYVPKLDSVLLQAWVGGTVSEAADLSEAERDCHIRRSSKEVASCGVDHIQKDKHLLWSEEVQRVMVIDFEKDDFDG